MKKQSFNLIISSIASAVFLTGCFSPTQSVVREFDDNGNVTRETVTSESVVKTLADAAKDKTVVAWDNSFIAYLSAGVSTEENLTPAVRIGAGKADRGLMTMPTGHDVKVAPDIVRAAREGSLEVTSSGIGSGSSKKTEEAK